MKFEVVYSSVGLMIGVMLEVMAWHLDFEELVQRGPKLKKYCNASANGDKKSKFSALREPHGLVGSIDDVGQAKLENFEMLQAE
ncbi:unnamed protein product [Sphenostylis stenocarpa]|uniref:Uncharacterized protein n=1 Tax=Sphenostylis stenocarpa TaxID=92480 RepID=A0AA86SH81_9FABA|nr:unnamed protein product [Sphenostylis stenocarpa]